MVNYILVEGGLGLRLLNDGIGVFQPVCHNGPKDIHDPKLDALSIGDDVPFGVQLRRVALIVGPPRTHRHLGGIA